MTFLRFAKAVSDGIGSFADKVIESGKHLKQAVQAYLATTTYVDTQIGTCPRCPREKSRTKTTPLSSSSPITGFTWEKNITGKRRPFGRRERTSLLMFRAPGVTESRKVCLNGSYPCWTSTPPWLN